MRPTAPVTASGMPQDIRVKAYRSHYAVMGPIRPVWIENLTQAVARVDILIKADAEQ